MYAKLVFPVGTDYTKICRDIARCIDNSDGAGGSKVADLEFVTAADSSIDDTVAASWSLSTGQTISTGSTNVEQDKKFYFQEAHANTSTKYVALRTAYEDSSGFTKANNRQYSGVCLHPVCDKGESYEYIPGTPSTSASTSTTNSFNFLMTGPVFYVIARAGTIMIAGDSNTGSLTTNSRYGHSASLITETAEQREHREGRNRPAQVWHMLRAFPNYSYGTGESISSVGEVINYTSTNIWGVAENVGHYVCLIDAAYDYTNNFEIRVLGFNGHEGSISHNRRDPSSVSPNANGQFAITRDTSEATGNKYIAWQTDSSWRNVSNGSGASISFRISGFIHGYETHGFSGLGSWGGWNLRNPQLYQHLNGMQSKKVDGTDVIKMYPMIRHVGEASAIYDLTDAADCYIGSSNFLGNFNDSISDGTDTYLGIKFYDTSSLESPSAFIIKK